MGSDQFGGQVMLHPPIRDQNLAVGRVSFVEFDYVGQAFRLDNNFDIIYILGFIRFICYLPLISEISSSLSICENSENPYLG
jgi:hypothetical protein